MENDSLLFTNILRSFLIYFSNPKSLYKIENVLKYFHEFCILTGQTEILLHNITSL